VAELRDEIKNKEADIQQVKEELNLTFIDTILFDLGQARVSSDGKQRLKKVAGILSKIENGKIRIQGHTDNIPISERFRYKYPSNWELSAARAAAVARYFIEQGGLTGENIEAVGYSHYKPIADNSTPGGRSQNRRVEIVIAPSFE
jgi:chemotaxis protein MotB